MSIRELLQQEIDTWALLGHPALIQRFVLAKGKVYSGEARPPGFQKYPDRQCFENSFFLVKHSKKQLKYVEGYGYNPDVGLLVHHAWVEFEGHAIDCTWKTPSKCLYMGVVMDFEAVDRETDRNGCFSVLDTGFGMNTRWMFEQYPELEAQCMEVRQNRGKLKALLENKQ